MVKSTDLNEEKKTSEKSVKSGDPANEPGMRVGDNFQAEVPEMLTDMFVKDARPEPLLVWAPCEKIPDTKVEDFLKIAKEKFGYNMEQALGMLYWHKYEIDKAMEDLRNFTPLPDEWSMEDKVIFEQSFGSYGKSFPRIRQQLPDKSIGTLVKYYYAWKKNRNKKSLMDKGERRDQGILNGIFADDSADNDSSDSDYEPNEKKMKTSKNDEKNATENKPSPMLSTNCVNCAGVTSQMNSTPRGKMCVSCYDYWRRTGDMRPKDKESLSLYHGPQHKLKRKPPKGMQLNETTLVEIAQAHGDSHIRPLEIELINLKRRVITDKLVVQEQRIGLDGKEERYRPPELRQNLNQRWTNEELLIAVQCVRKYGKDFQAMSEVLGNKNSGQCRNFFLNYRRRFNLLDVLSEYEKENNIPRSESCVNDAWDEVAGGEPDNNIYPPSSVDLTSTLQASSNQPPPLRRQADNIPVNDTPPSQGPPPLVNNATANSITSSAIT